MIWAKLPILQAFFGAEAKTDEVAARWYHARRRAPELAADLVRMGGLLVAQPLIGGEVVNLDPARLAYEAGRRDICLTLLAMMSLEVPELNSLMEDNDVSRLED